MAEWEEALETEHQRQAKLIVMEAIHAALRKGRKEARQEIRKELAQGGYLTALEHIDRVEAEKEAANA